MNKIGIYYIATNKYVTFFDTFLEGLVNFFPTVKKKVILITDCDKINFEEKSTEEIEVVQKHIDHHYWPIPTLFKMFYMDKFFTEDCDYHFFCNSNIKFTKKYEFDEEYDMHLSKHYLSNQLSMYTINNGNNNNCVIPPTWAKCHISPQEIPYYALYCQGGFFGGKTEKIHHLLNDINDMLKEDLKHNIIPIWHDETYLNKYLLKYFWNNNIVGNVNIISIYDYATLLDKNDYFDKFNL